MRDRGGLTNRQGHRKLCDRFGNAGTGSCPPASRFPTKAPANEAETLGLNPGYHPDQTPKGD